jgi:hypothetical protein
MSNRPETNKQSCPVYKKFIGYFVEKYNEKFFCKNP